MERYVVEKDREAICAQLNDLENWLYEDGEDCDRDTYVNKLKALQSQTTPIKERATDYEYCPGVFEELKSAINHARFAVNEFKKGSAKYDHLTETEFINIAENADKAQKWLDTNLAKFAQASRTTDSPVKASDIRHEVQTLNTCINSVVNRPKPKPAAKPAQQPTNKEGGAEQQNGNENKSDSGDKSAHTNNVPEDSTMDVE